MSVNHGKQPAIDFAERVRGNQRTLRDSLRSNYDFIVCGSGSSGSVVARRLAENRDVSVLLLEAGGSDEVPSVTEAARWFENLRSERDWNFVEIAFDGKTQRIRAGREVVLSLGAMHTPKVLMLSGIGDQAELQRLGIPVVQHLPGVGQNFQDHSAFGCVWEYRQPLAPRNNGAEATFFWKSNPGLDTPDLQTCQIEGPVCSAETGAKFNPPPVSWTMYGSVVRPKSRGQIRLTGPNPDDPIQIESNTLSHPDDLKAAVACVELCREIGNSAALRPFTKREVMPGNLRGTALEDFIRDEVSTYHHETCTAKMGRDSMSVVDGQLKVYGIENLRIADGSIMPRVPTGNAMASCIVIGERAAEALRNEHRLEPA